MHRFKKFSLLRYGAMALCALSLPSIVGCRKQEPSSDMAELRQTEFDVRAEHFAAIVIDMHADTAQRLLDEGIDLETRLPNGHLDGVRMREGGLDAQFFAVWVEPQFYGVGGRRAVERADAQIAAVRAMVERHPDRWALATGAEEIERAAREGKLAALLGLEGGYAIDERLENVERYYRMGVRYMSPTWTVSLSWAGSSGDAAGRTRGLNDFGRAVIGEMNRLGMMVDVSHVSDRTFWDIIETSRAPVIASHSGARAIVDVPRNLADDQLRALARTGGVCAVIFYPAFIEPGWEKLQARVEAEIAPLVRDETKNLRGSPSQRRAARDRVREREFARRLPPVFVSRVVDHIDHIVRVAGIDHVALGSDFDGIQSVPQGLASVADLPNLTAELARRGYSPSEIRKILGENVLRVMREVERRATQLQQTAR
ncbi:dipeptidase [Pyrinomonas sp.]|uniref:dipeptidase n=1 Tax=Pyrinomonas sp. TaxID=2080306 RepID=UPI00332AB4C4